jgi:hypothetical protein
MGLRQKGGWTIQSKMCSKRIQSDSRKLFSGKSCTRCIRHSTTLTPSHQNSIQVIIRTIDIETAFLYGGLEEELWMAIPNGYPRYMKEKHHIDVDPKTQCLKLAKAIYGLVQDNGGRSLKKFCQNLASNHQEKIHASSLRIRMDARKNTSSFILTTVESLQMKKKSNRSSHHYQMYLW